MRTPSAEFAIAASPSAVVPMKLPLSVFCSEPLSIRMPFLALPETRFPSGGTTNTGVTVPLLPVGLFAWPVTLSTNLVPPISLPLDDAVSQIPFWPLAIANLPLTFVPTRLAAMTLPDDP